ELAAGVCARQVEPPRLQRDGELVGDTEARERLLVSLRVKPGMVAAEIAPLLAKGPRHDPRAQLDVRFAFRAIHIRLADVSQVMHEECGPETRIARRAVQLRPGRRDEPRVDKELMCPEQDALGSDLHAATAFRDLPPPASRAWRRRSASIFLSALARSAARFSSRSCSGDFARRFRILSRIRSPVRCLLAW